MQKKVGAFVTGVHIFLLIHLTNIRCNLIIVFRKWLCILHDFKYFISKLKYNYYGDPIARSLK